MNINKSTGYDDIAALSLRKCADVIAPTLSDILNLTIFSGIYPDSLKIARVTPVHKSESKDNPNNYRPISILPVLNKIFETVLHSRLMSFLDSQNFLYNKQYGFRKKSGTHTVTYELLNELLLDSSNGLVSGVFL